MEVDEEYLFAVNRDWMIVHVAFDEWLVVPRNLEVHPDRANKLVVAAYEELDGKKQVVFEGDDILSPGVKRSISLCIRHCEQKRSKK